VLGPRTILEVGWDGKLLATRRLVLEGAGYNVESVLTSQHAYQRVQHNSFDLLLLCHSMPEEDQRELTEQVRRLHPETLILSLYESTPTNLSADAVFNPLDGPEILLNCVARLFQRGKSKPATASDCSQAA